MQQACEAFLFILALYLHPEDVNPEIVFGAERFGLRSLHMHELMRFILTERFWLSGTNQQGRERYF